jgi:16S rRNA (uracil1498-N3)-methyltransferase
MCPAIIEGLEPYKISTIGENRLELAARCGQYAHMKRHRFKVDDLSAERITIRDREAHHAVHVLRVRQGEEILLIDGHGGEALALVESLAGQELVARITERREANVRSSGLILATAIPKGERADWMIEKCAELGVSRLIPLISERSQVHPGAGKLTRWQRKVEAAAKQSGQSHLMTIDEPMEPERVMGVYKENPKFYGDPGADDSLLEQLKAQTQGRPTVFLVGPEGGFSDQEIRCLREAGALGVRLGTAILRIETAALAVAVIAGMCMVAGQKSDHS